MAPVIDEGVSSLSFCLEGDGQIVLCEYIRELFGFRKEALEEVDVQENVLEGFWGLILGKDNRQRSSIRNPIIGVCPSWMCKSILGRIKETKMTDIALNWLYSGLIARQEIDTSYIMLNRWCCETTSGTGDIGSGCYLSLLAISLRLRITRNPKFLLTGSS
jgi:hypothetical protein